MTNENPEAIPLLVTETQELEDAPRINGAVWLGGVIAAAFIGGFVGWGAVTPLASASIAEGVLGVEGRTRTVQHLEGGIVRDIRVQNGDVVSAGDVLVQLDDTKARATYDLLAQRRLATLAKLARLQAEQSGKDAIVFPGELSAQLSKRASDMVAGQVAVFTSRRDNLLSQKAVLEDRVSEYREEIKGLKGRIKGDYQQLKLTEEQIADVKTLLTKGLARKPRLLELEVKASEIESRIRHNTAQIARNEQRIQGTRASIAELQTKQASQVADALSGAESELLDLAERVRAAEDVLTRTQIIAPLAGVVTNLRVHTSGGVVSPGEPLADIVPEDEKLIIEARVKPDDIDVVRAGLKAHVRFTALSQRTTKPVPGLVHTISADRLVDEVTGETYFLASVELDDKENIVPADLLYPGMTAEVMIETGSRSALAYMFEPLINSFNRAFREN